MHYLYTYFILKESFFRTNLNLSFSFHDFSAEIFGGLS